MESLRRIGDIFTGRTLGLVLLWILAVGLWSVSWNLRDVIFYDPGNILLRLVWIVISPRRCS